MIRALHALHAAMAEDTDDWDVRMEEAAARLPMSPSDEPWYDDARIAAWVEDVSEDVEDAPTVTGGMTHEPIRMDGFMWDALMVGGAK
jgi:hypothetical protein